MNDAMTPGSFAEPVGRSVSAALGSRTGRWLVYALVFFWTVPTFGLAVSSVRSEINVKTSGWWRFFLSPSFTLDNYESVLSGRPGQPNLGYFFMNSLKIAVPATLLSVGVALLAAYAFSWMTFKGRDWLFVGVVALLMVPLQMALVPLLLLFGG